MKRGDTVFIDTNAIAAAHQFRILAAVRGGVALHTVSECLDEATRPNRRGKVLYSGSREDLAAAFATVHSVTDIMRVDLARTLPLGLMLDPGERDLLAAAFASGANCWWLCGPDRAALRALISRGRGMQMVSLERVAGLVGQTRRDLPPQFTERWLQTERARLELDFGQNL